MDDPRVGRDDLEAGERSLSPAEERVSLAVALELFRGVRRKGGGRPVLVDLNGVVDDELGREDRIDPSRIASHPPDRIAHGRKVDDGRNPREIL